MAWVIRRLSLPGALNWITYCIMMQPGLPEHDGWALRKISQQQSALESKVGLHGLFSPRLRRHPVILWMLSLLYTESLRPGRFKRRDQSQIAGLFKNHHIENSHFIFLFLTAINMRCLTYCFRIHDFRGGRLYFGCNGYIGPEATSSVQRHEFLPL